MQHARLLDELRRQIADAGDDLLGLAQTLLAHAPDGRAKLYVTARALACRREHPELFAHGDYRPLEVVGPAAEHVCAFARGYNGTTVVVAAPRLVLGLVSDVERPPIGATVWRGMAIVLPEALAHRRLHNRLTGEELESQPGEHGVLLDAVQVFEHFPAALLVTVDR
jgi:(1->4)-alpha-D-glucan 1-alpha-D-glucosylmutase